MLHTIQVMTVATFNQMFDVLSMAEVCNALHHSGPDYI